MRDDGGREGGDGAGEEVSLVAGREDPKDTFDRL